MKGRKRYLPLLLAGALTASMLVLPSAAAKAPTANSSRVTFNGREIELPAYRFQGNNYIKLRDLAKLLDGSPAQFDVGWAPGVVTMTTGRGYTPVGGELTQLTTGAGCYSNAVVQLDGEPVVLRGINIGNANYFKLRDLGAVLNFGVDWDEASGTVVLDTAKSYTEPARAASGINTYPLTMIGRTYGEICSILPFAGTGFQEGNVAVFDCHGAKLTLGFSGNSTGTFQADDVCDSVLIELGDLVNGCPDQSSAQDLRELFGDVEVNYVDGDVPEWTGYRFELYNGFFSIHNFYYAPTDHLGRHELMFITTQRWETELGEPRPLIPLGSAETQTEPQGGIAYADYRRTYTVDKREPMEWNGEPSWSGSYSTLKISELDASHVKFDMELIDYYGSDVRDSLSDIVGYSTDGRTYQLTDIEDSWMNRYNGTLTLLDGGGVRLELNYTKLDDWARMTVTGTHEFTE